jgi:DNA-binding cell septation regulator SpoVG
VLIAVLIAGGAALRPVAARAEDGDVFVTDVLIVDDTASVTINDAIQVRDVKIIKTGGRTTLKFPEFVTKRGKAYPQVTVSSKKAYDAIVQAVTSGKPSKEKAKSIKFRVDEPHLLRSPVRRANVEVSFNDAFSVTLGVLKSKRADGNPYWIGYPGRRDDASGKYLNEVVITNPKLKKAVEDAALEKFERALKESGGEQGAQSSGGDGQE